MKATKRVHGALALALAVLPTAALAQERPTLELTLEDAVRRTLENNVDIAVDRFIPESRTQDIKSAEGAYDPTAGATLTQGSRASAASNVFAGAQKVETDNSVWNFNATQALKTGAALRLDWNNSRADTNSIFTTFNPSYNSSMALNLSQPLLRDFKIDSSRQQLRVSKKNKEISDVNFRQTVINTVATVKKLYYNLIYAIDNLEAQRKSLALAKRLLEENQIKVRVGTLAPLDVVLAESEVAAREEAVIVAEATLADFEDVIKRAIFPQSSPELWILRVIPKDRPTADVFQVDEAAAIKNALENRTDVVNARKTLELAAYSLQYTKNQVLPTVDLIGTLGAAGIGGTSIQREGLGGPVISTVEGGYGDALSDLFSFKYPNWTVGVNFSYPIRNRSADAAAARSRIARDQALASLARLEMQVAYEVRTAARAVESNFKRVASSRAARVLRERQLDAEQKKFAAGMSTNFLVTQAQRDLAVAEVAEISAIADYRKSLVDYGRVQESGTTGVGSSLSVSTTTSATAAAGASVGAGQSTGGSSQF
jgi:outer membrane protein